MAASQTTKENQESQQNDTQKDKKEENPISLENMPDWMLARHGIKLVINNKSDEAITLFKKYPDNLLMFAGYATTIFLDALMSLEEDKLNLALTNLKETDRRCSSDSGWLKSVKNRMFGSSEVIQKSLQERLETQIILADSQCCIALLTFLQQDISGYFKGGWVLRKSWKVYQSTYKEISTLYAKIVGELPMPMDDSSENSENTPVQPESVCSSISEHGMGRSMGHSLDSSFTLQSDDASMPPPEVEDLPDPQFSSSSEIKKSVKITNGYKHLSNSSSRSVPRSYSAHFRSPSRNSSRGSMKKSRSVNHSLSSKLGFGGRESNAFSPLSDSLSSLFSSSFSVFRMESDESIDKETITRLMGAISFGYGLFQLGVSLLPPSLLKFTNFLGFSGNRQAGIQCLMYARLKEDMRAPLATLALLWYHTIIRPFYALDGRNVQAGATESERLLEESEEEYKDSALFLFFRGRVYRLQSEIPAALEAFQQSVENATQREVKLLSLHEVAWCYIIQLDYPQARATLDQLCLLSRWSGSFYSYLKSICAGAADNFDAAALEEMKGLFGKTPKGSQLDVYLSRRYKLYPRDEKELDEVDDVFWKLLVYEMLYLWNTLPSCSSESLDQILEDCESVSQRNLREPMLGLSKLIQGACFCLKQNSEMGVSCFRSSLEQRKDSPRNAEDAHVSAFSLYELGSLLVKSPETKDEGKSMLHEINNYSGFDFEARLHVRVNSLLKHL